MRGILSFLLGFTLTLGVMGTLSSCGGGGGGSTTTPVCVPSVGQWCSDGSSVGQSFGFNVVRGYVYTGLATAPQVGQTYTLNYTLTGTNPVWVNDPNGGDSGAPTIHLFLWQRLDNESCQGDYNFYRLFAARTPLVLGANQTISAPLNGAVWQGCYPSNIVTDARLQTALNNLFGIGLTFGGQSFAGHGISVSSGSATFTINSFTVQ